MLCLREASNELDARIDLVQEVYCIRGLAKLITEYCVSHIQLFEESMLKHYYRLPENPLTHGSPLELELESLKEMYPTVASFVKKHVDWQTLAGQLELYMGDMNRCNRAVCYYYANCMCSRKLSTALVMSGCVIPYF